VSDEIATTTDNASFNQAIFKSYTSFLSTTFKNDSAFIAINGQNFFSLEQVKFYAVPDFSQAHFAEAPRLDNSYFRPTPGESRGWWGLRLSGDTQDITARWRALRRLAVQAHDHERELVFLAEEIKSLRGIQDWVLPNPLIFRAGEPICWPGGGRYWAGLFYQWFSNFGRSMLRPFLWWVIITTVFAFYFYYLSDKSLSITCCSGSDPVTAALYLSISNAFVISISGLGRSEKLTQSYACLYGSSGEDKLAAAMLDAAVFASIAQTILSAGLIFLFLLALRNYFRIK
jgi:hypothetical protein